MVQKEHQMVFETFTEWEERPISLTEMNIHQESDETVEVMPDGSVRLPGKLLDEIGWKVKTKLVVLDSDIKLSQITIGKQIHGHELVNVMQEIAKRFS